MSKIASQCCTKLSTINFCINCKSHLCNYYMFIFNMCILKKSILLLMIYMCIQIDRYSPFIHSFFPVINNKYKYKILYVTITCLITIHSMHFKEHLFVDVSAWFRSQSNMCLQHVGDTGALPLKHTPVIRQHAAVEVFPSSTRGPEPRHTRPADEGGLLP